MRRTRIGLASLLSVAVLALALAVDPVAAQTSASAELIHTLNGKLMYAAIPITLLVELVLFYAVFKFKDADEAKPTRENRRLEISWTIATALVLVFVGVASYGVLTHDVIAYQGNDVRPSTAGQDAVVVHAEAYQWGWDFSYPEYNVSSSSVVIPVDRPVYIKITSRDVIHSFHVPKLGLKQDAIPGETNTIKTVPYQTGTYQGYCAEFCGVAHSQMTFTVEVRSQQDYQNWIQEQTSSGGSGNSTNSSASGGGSGTATPSGELRAPAAA